MAIFFKTALPKNENSAPGVLTLAATAEQGLPKSN
jgi:hypothetical protein